MDVWLGWVGMLGMEGAINDEFSNALSLVYLVSLGDDTPLTHRTASGCYVYAMVSCSGCLGGAVRWEWRGLVVCGLL